MPTGLCSRPTVRWGIPGCQRVARYDRSMLSWNLVLAVARRPGLWAEGVRALLAVSHRQWWRRRPFLPVPDTDYTSWRVATAHGDAAAVVDAGELISYLEWRKRQHRPLRRV